jgi:hypothetical protein
VPTFSADLVTVSRLVSRAPLGEPEVPDLDDPVLEEEVGRLEVPVHDAVFCQVEEPRDEVPEVGRELVLAEAHLPPDQLREVALVAELGDDVGVVLGVEDVAAADDVAVVEHLEEVDLLDEHVPLDLVGQQPPLDHLDGHLLICPLVPAPVHHAAEALPDRVRQQVRVVPDLLLLRHRAFPVRVLPLLGLAPVHFQIEMAD